MKDQTRLRTWAVIFLLVSIFVGIALIPQLNHYGGESVANSAENQFMYQKSIDVLLMLLIGFGFLMVFSESTGTPP